MSTNTITATTPKGTDFVATETKRTTHKQYGGGECDVVEYSVTFDNQPDGMTYELSINEGATKKVGHTTEQTLSFWIDYTLARA